MESQTANLLLSPSELLASNQSCQFISTTTLLPQENAESVSAISAYLAHMEKTYPKSLYPDILTLGQLRDHLDKILPRSPENDAIPIVRYVASGDDELPVETIQTLPTLGYVKNLTDMDPWIEFEPSDEKQTKVLLIGEGYM